MVDESIALVAGPPTQTPDVGPLPPDAGTAENAVGVYLYHLHEEAALKKAVWPGRPSLRCARRRWGSTSLRRQRGEHARRRCYRPLTEAVLMGLAVKALHDWPVIDDSTVINGVTILHWTCATPTTG